MICPDCGCLVSPELEATCPDCLCPLTKERVDWNEKVLSFIKEEREKDRLQLSNIEEEKIDFDISSIKKNIISQRKWIVAIGVTFLIACGCLFILIIYFLSS